MSRFSTDTKLLATHGAAIGVLTTTANHWLTILPEAMKTPPIVTLLISTGVVGLGAAAYTETLIDLKKKAAALRYTPVLTGLALGASFGLAVMGATSTADRFINSYEKPVEETEISRSEKILAVCVMPLDGPPPPCNAF